MDGLLAILFKNLSTVGCLPLIKLSIINNFQNILKQPINVNEIKRYRGEGVKVTATIPLRFF